MIVTFCQFNNDKWLKQPIIIVTLILGNVRLKKEKKVVRFYQISLCVYVYHSEAYVLNYTQKMFKVKVVDLWLFDYDWHPLFIHPVNIKHICPFLNPEFNILFRGIFESFHTF